MSDIVIPKTSGIYKIECIANGKIYVGSAINLNKRNKRHFSELRSGTHFNARLQNAFNKYEEGKFKFSVIEICDVDCLIEREQYYIDSFNPEFNIRRTAESNAGIKWSQESKSRASKLHRQMGFRQSEEAKAKISDGLKGRIFSEDHRKRLAEKRKRPVHQVDLKLGVILFTYNSQEEAALALGINYRGISEVCRGRNKSAAGYGWRYADGSEFFDDSIWL